MSCVCRKENIMSMAVFHATFLYARFKEVFCAKESSHHDTSGISCLGAA